MNKLILFVIALSGSTALFAQQDPIYAQYILNPIIINPAYAGLGNNLNAMVSYRTQWVGLDGQPQTFNASGNVSLVDNRVGAGITITRDQIGSTTTMETNAAFSYKLPLGDDKVLSFGMQGGVLNFRNDYSALNPYDKDDVAFTGGERGSRINLGVGVILKSERFLFGLSVPRLLPTTFKAGNSSFDLYTQHFYVFSAYVWYINERIRFKPTILARLVNGAPPSFDIGTNLNFNGLHTVGVFIRKFNTYGLLVQTLLAEKFRLGYVFELPTGNSVGANFTSHEISLGIRMSVLDFHERTLSNFN